MILAASEPGQPTPPRARTPEAIAENGELLRAPDALRIFAWLLNSPDIITADDAVFVAVHLEVERLRETGIEDDTAFKAVLVKLAIEGAGLIPAWLCCGTPENTEAVEEALIATRQLIEAERSGKPS